MAPVLKQGYRPKAEAEGVSIPAMEMVLRPNRSCKTLDAPLSQQPGAARPALAFSVLPRARVAIYSQEIRFKRSTKARIRPDLLRETETGGKTQICTTRSAIFPKCTWIRWWEACSIHAVFMRTEKLPQITEPGKAEVRAITWPQPDPENDYAAEDRYSGEAAHRSTVLSNRSGNRLSDLDLGRADLPLCRSDLETHLLEKTSKDKKSSLFIKTMGGSTICIEIGTWEATEILKQRIHEKTGILPYKQLLIYAGKVIQEGFKLMEYGIEKDSTICLSSRLRGGCPGSSSKGPVSFKDAVKGKMEPKKKTKQQATAPGAYIVEQTTQNPALAISIPEVNEIQTDYLTKGVICRFNGFWPKPEALRQWIYSIWTENCDIHLCSKGFFIVKFETIKDKEYALNEGPWFWGNAGLFVKSWFPDFDPNSMVVTKMPVWVKLFNLPIHFWHYKVLEGIGNTLGSFLKADHERLSKDIYTFARICVEVDLSQGLPEHIILIHNGKQWTQPLDYENTAFRCCICRQTGHLQSTCPQRKKDRKRRQPPKPKGWQFSATWAEDVEEDKEEERNAEATNNLQEDEVEKNNPEISNASYPHHNEYLIEGAIDTNADNP